MGNSLKSLLQQRMHNKQVTIYERELKLQKDSYAAFLRTYEDENLSDEWIDISETSLQIEQNINQYKKTAVICNDSVLCGENGEFLWEERLFSEDLVYNYILFAAAGGKVSSNALRQMETYFEEHPKTDVIYFHRDEADESGNRSNPIFLPEWSPDTYASSFYFGGCFAVRKEAFRKAVHLWNSAVKNGTKTEIQNGTQNENQTGNQTGLNCGMNSREFLYALVLMMTPAKLMDVVMYHRTAFVSDVNGGERLAVSDNEDKDRRTVLGNKDKDGLTGTDMNSSADELYFDIVWKHIERLVPSAADREKYFGCWTEYASRKELCKTGHKVSILIPSKDHPDLLKRCVESIRRYDDIRAKEGGSSYEIIVVDNGSEPGNRKLYESYGEKYGYRYEYIPMEFNFSKMCNMAAEKADGDYYLFLNDDMEALDADWMGRLMEIACLSHVGATGAKLLYPDTTLIQHAGITNMYQGPAHKMLKYDDKEEYYCGRNRRMWDVIGVTAACLMISKEKYDLIGGFSEELKVAYNDVDFCFRLHRKGLFNVVRNDVILYHHESLSRGNDLLDPAKSKRLMAERKVLYERNPGYYDYDPFYSRHLTGVSEAYECCLPYENRNIRPINGVKKISGEYPGITINETLIISVDAAEKEPWALRGEQKGYLIDLHAHVRGLDSCDYQYRMVLKGQKECYEIPASRRYRPDVVRNIHNENHVELSGFEAKIPEGMLPADIYEIWMEAKCVYSRQRLCNRAKETLVIE